MWWYIMYLRCHSDIQIYRNNICSVRLYDDCVVTLSVRHIRIYRVAYWRSQLDVKFLQLQYPMSSNKSGEKLLSLSYKMLNKMHGTVTTFHTYISGTKILIGVRHIWCHIIIWWYIKNLRCHSGVKINRNNIGSVSFYTCYMNCLH